MILDNRDKVKSLLKFGNNTYYYLQILQRRKENPELDTPEIKRWRLYITSLKSLELADPYIEFLCKNLNARAYISVIPRSLEKYCKEVAKEYINHICIDEYSQCFRYGDRIALSEKTISWRGIIPQSRILLDFDTLNKEEKEKIDTKKFLEEEGKIKVEEIIDTKNGFHVICENHNSIVNFKDSIISAKSNGDVIIKSKLFNRNFEYTIIREVNTVYYASWGK